MGDKHQRKADRLNAKTREEIPLFADQVPTVTRTEMFWHWRRNKALAGEGVSTFAGECLLDWFAVGRLLRLAREHLTAVVYERLHAYCARTYPRAPEYWLSFWGRILTGSERVVYSWQWVDDPTIKAGRRLVDDEVWPPAGWVAPFTRESLKALCNPPGPEYVQPADGGVAERLDKLFQGINQRNQP